MLRVTKRRRRSSIGRLLRRRQVGGDPARNIIGTYNAFEAARGTVRAASYSRQQPAVASTAATKPSITAPPEAGQPLRRIEGVREALGASTPTSTEWKWCACASATSIRDRWTRGASRSGSRRAISPSSCRSRSIAGHPLRDRVRSFRQQAPLVRQLERRAARLPPAGRQRVLRRGDPREREARRGPAHRALTRAEPSFSPKRAAIHALAGEGTGPEARAARKKRKSK